MNEDIGIVHPVWFVEYVKVYAPAAEVSPTYVNKIILRELLDGEFTTPPFSHLLRASAVVLSDHHEDILEFLENNGKAEEVKKFAKEEAGLAERSFTTRHKIMDMAACVWANKVIDAVELEQVQKIQVPDPDTDDFEIKTMGVLLDALEEHFVVGQRTVASLRKVAALFKEYDTSEERVDKYISLVHRIKCLHRQVYRVPGAFLSEYVGRQFSKLVELHEDVSAEEWIQIVKVEPYAQELMGFGNDTVEEV